MSLITNIVESLNKYNIEINEVKNTKDVVINTQLLSNKKLLLEVNKRNEITVHQELIDLFLHNSKIEIDENITLYKFNEFYNNLVKNKINMTFDMSGLNTYDIDKVYNVYSTVVIDSSAITSARFIIDKMPIISKNKDIYQNEYVEKAFLVFTAGNSTFATEVDVDIVKQTKMSDIILQTLMIEFKNGGNFGLDSLLESPGGMDDFAKMFGSVTIDQ